MRAFLTRRLTVTILGCLIVASLGKIPATAQSVGWSFEGLKAPTGSVPPDPHGAAGPNGVVATANLQVTYYSTVAPGGQVWGPVSFTTFFSSAGITANGQSDPRAIYDPASRKFFVILQENTGSQFWFDVAVSKNSDPRTSGATDWSFYRLDATEYAASNPAGGVNYGGDYPGLAVDSRALYATYRMYGFNPNGTLNGSGSSYINTSLLILNKSQLLAGSPTLVSMYLSNAFGTQVAQTGGGATDNVVYLVDNTSASQITIYAVTDPLNSRLLNSVPLTITNRGTGVGTAPQSGTTLTIPTIDRTQSAFVIPGLTAVKALTLYQGDIWFSATRGTTGGKAVAAYYRIRLNGWPSANSPTLVEDTTMGNSSEWNYSPAIAANDAGDVVITWTRSSSVLFPTIMYASRLAGAASFGAPQAILPANPGGTSNTFNADGRWADYFTVWPDPKDGSLWFTNEWTRLDTGTWSTWWAQINVPFRDAYVDLNADPFSQDGSSAHPWRSVLYAHQTISYGAIHIAPGRYNEQLTLSKKTTISVSGTGQVVIGAP